MEKIICIAGFGDNISMFQPLMDTHVAVAHEILLLNLPGFGAPPLNEETTLEKLAETVNTFARKVKAGVILAHSVASIVASLAALRANSPIDTILSLEGNLTAADAYFSGTAADFDTASAFYTNFLSRLDAMAADQPIIARYRDNVAQADVQALWELGNDARRYSETHTPGDTLLKMSSAFYFYNPANMPQASLNWLNSHNLSSVQLDNASHWPSIDQPLLLSEKITEVLSGIEKRS